MLIFVDVNFLAIYKYALLQKFLRVSAYHFYNWEIFLHKIFDFGK